MPRLDQFFLPYLDTVDPERADVAIYSAGLVALSLAIAIGSAYVALSVSDRLIATRTRRGRFAWTGAGAVSRGGGWPNLATSAGAIILGLAVAGMHYAAMEAANFFAAPDSMVGAVHFEPTSLAVVMVVLVLSLGAATMAADDSGAQIDTAQRAQSEMLQRPAVERDAARVRARALVMVDSVADAIVTIDRARCIRQGSSGAERIFGYTQDEMIGADITTLMPDPTARGTTIMSAPS